MKKYTVLIVDDQEINRRILKKLLADEYDILEAENGRVALDMLHDARNTITAVLLDIIMPVMDGYAVLSEMQRDPDLAVMPVIVSSQRDGDADEIRALSLGAQDFISKPYKGDIIMHRLKNTIRLRETAAIVNRAEKDELTGLLSKQFFCERVSRVLEQNPDQNYDILCFDIKRFKLVNDTYGAETGDRLLKHLAGIINAYSGAVCTARFDADHFFQLVYHPEGDCSASMRAMFEKVEDFPIEMQIRVSCGVYQIEDTSTSVVGMCDRAKLAANMHHKQGDCPFFFYDDSIRQKMLDDQFIISGMKDALSGHQFKVYYQPKYDLHTEMIVGAEALVRWQHPERGFMSPGQFIPVLEGNGLISQLDRYVWEEVCRNIRAWMDEGLPPVPVSVNVSRADFLNPHLTDVITGLTEKYNIPIPYLHLEITESAYADDPEQIISVVHRLKDIGFIIEMDDFGSGYSSLNMLAELPVDVLKLDMRFVQMESRHTSGRGIMSFVISLAKWMRLSVIAEGVETAEQVETLRSMDCSFVQGYYYAKPMPREDFENNLSTIAVEALKAAPMAAGAQSGDETKDRSARDKVMLIVDDVMINRAVLTSIFEDEYRIVEKENGREALEYLRAHGSDVDIMLLDLLMPVMDGFRLLEIIRADERLSRIPVVVTSQGDVAAEEKALDMGADDFISKPYSPQIVRHRVSNVVKVYHMQIKQTQELSTTRRREQTLMESIPGGVAIYHLKKNGRISTEYASEGLARMCGYNTKEFMELTKDDVRAVIAAEDLPHLLDSIMSGLKDHKAMHDIHHLRTRDGHFITVRTDGNVISEAGMCADDQAVLYAVHTKESEEAESALQEQNRYRYIMDNLDVAYFELDADGHSYFSDKYSLYVMSNENAADILNNSGNYAGVYPEDLPLLFDFFELKSRNLPKIATTLRLRMKDGTYRWTEMMGFYEYDAHGRRIRTIGVLRDVDTEWQNQNRKLQDALASAEKANRAKTDFLARVSHEMRTPLNGILGITHLLEARADGDDIHGDIEKLKQSGEYLLNLINDTLDVSTIERGRMELNPTVCDGKTAFNNIIALAMPGIEAKHIKFNMQAENLPFTKLYIDVGRVEQAVMNILGNAVKFTPDGGTIDFIMENISNENGLITDRLIIRDNGIGMSEEFLERVFEPFSQEHNSSNSVYSGTGLGTTIARQCIELMGGTISIRSKAGKGTEVTMILPMPVATPEQLDMWRSANRAEDLSRLKGKHVLLCEDHPLNAQIAIRLLEKKGMRVEHAENGKTGVEMFAASTPGYYDVVLMDIRMPVMNGLEATRRIRSLNRSDARRVPIVAMTANALRQDVKDSLNAGMTEHLGKPIEPAKLYHSLASIISTPYPFVGKKVLVVDDIEMNRALVRKAISDIYSVVEASSGVEALDMLNNSNDIVAVVTDVQMPHMDGKEMIKRIRADRRFDHLAILANTIYGDHRQEDELLAIGANDFVYKPASPQVILMRMEHVLRNMA